jgi:FlaG/FlaF family flagellin (archaellin)
VLVSDLSESLAVDTDGKQAVEDEYVSVVWCHQSSVDYTGRRSMRPNPTGYGITGGGVTTKTAKSIGHSTNPTEEVAIGPVCTVSRQWPGYRQDNANRERVR